MIGLLTKKNYSITTFDFKKGNLYENRIIKCQTGS